MSKKKLENKVKKSVKKKPLLALLFVLLLGGGIAGGYFTASAITKNDTFELIGEQTITLLVGEDYQEKGAKVIAFGKDVSMDVVIEDNIDNTQEGQYYVKYTIDNWRYKGVVKYRYIYVVETLEEGGETL